MSVSDADIDRLTHDIIAGRESDEWEPARVLIRFVLRAYLVGRETERVTAMNDNAPMEPMPDPLAEVKLKAHDDGYEHGRKAGMGVMLDLLRRCEPFIAGLTRSHKPLKHDAQRLYDDIIGALKGAEQPPTGAKEER